MAFNLDRDGAAKRLGVSSRTIDRHIQAGRIRTRRIGKKMFLEEEDIEALRQLDPARSREQYEVIFDDEEGDQHEIIQPHAAITDVSIASEFTRLYTESQELIAKKDGIIQDLAYRLGKTETELKNSISMIEYKKATFLLESAKSKNDQDSQVLSEKIGRLETEINKRNAAIITLAILFVLVLAFSFMFFFYNRL